MISIFDKRITLKSYKSAYFKKSGFTLIELMVTVGIFVFMTALIMSRYNDFYSGIIFKNMAYDVAMTIRQAQSYGISVKADTSSNSFNQAYGVNFSSATPSQFSLFPYSGSGFSAYSPGPVEKSYTLKFGATIHKKYTENTLPIDNEVSVLDIIFQRPNPEANICGTSNGVTSCDQKYARIVLKLGEKTKEIEINSAGQVSIID